MPLAAAAAISAIGAISAAKMQSNSNRDATRMQSDAMNNAGRIQDDAARRAEQTQREQQDYERFQYASQQRARQPYVDLSNRSMGKLADMLGVPGGGPQMPPQMTNRAPASVNPMNLSAFSGGAQTTPEADTVTLQAPTGEMRKVPRGMVQQYVSRGARVING
jgi:hypothetical protein